MRKYLYIAAGGAAGAVLRSLAARGFLSEQSLIPFSTLAVNAAGSFLLAFVLTEAFELLGFNSSIKPGIAAGLLGAFTTFSTLCREIASLMFGGHYIAAVIYALLSVSAGIICAFAGFRAANAIIRRKFAVRELPEEEE